MTPHITWLVNNYCIAYACDDFSLWMIKMAAVNSIINYAKLPWLRKPEMTLKMKNGDSISLLCLELIRITKFFDVSPLATITSSSRAIMQACTV